ncbi:MAG: hypothetical protein ACT4NU_04230 [Chromatiales bacterium]
MAIPSPIRESIFRIIGVENSGDTATAVVRFPLQRSDPGIVKVAMVRLEIGWRIADFVYEDGATLRQLLSSD